MTDAAEDPAGQFSVLARAASGLSALACLAAALAFLREVALATSFGAGASVDAYLVALAVPFLLNTSIVSTLEAAFIPVYLASKTEGGGARAKQFAAATHFWLLLGGAFLTVMVYAALPLLLPLQAPGFPAERLALSQRLAWLMAPSVFFSCLYALGRSVLNAERRFIWPALAPGIGAGVTIAVILLGRRTFGINAAAAAYTSGIIAVWLSVYVPVVISRLPGRRLAPDWRNRDVVRLLRVAGPLLLGAVTTSTIAVVDRSMASRFPAGVISALSYADRIVQIPVTILATAVTTAAFPALSRYAAQRDLLGLRRTLGSGIQLLATALVPVAVLCVILSRDVVAVLFERGQFVASDAQTTTVLLSGLGLGLVFMGTFQLVPRVFNAMQLAPFVALSGFLNLGFKTVFNLILVPVFGYVGFALATSAMYIATGVIMLALLRRKLEHLDIMRTFPALSATALGAVVMAVVGYGAAFLLSGSAPLTRLVLASGMSIAAYVGTVWTARGRPVGW